MHTNIRLIDLLDALRSRAEAGSYMERFPLRHSGKGFIIFIPEDLPTIEMSTTLTNEDNSLLATMGIATEQRRLSGNN